MSIVRRFMPKPGTCAHRVLWLTSRGAASMVDLYPQTHSIGQSKNLWEAKVVNPLVGEEFIERNGDVLRITQKGFAKFCELDLKQPINEVMVTVATKPEKFVPVGNYEGVGFNPDNIRPGATDFLRCPSRVGNQFIYRKGYENG